MNIKATNTFKVANVNVNSNSEQSNAKKGTQMLTNIRLG